MSDIIEYWKNACKEYDKKDTARKSEQSPPEGVKAVKNLPYVNDQRTEHLLDVFMPEQIDKNLPVIVDVHGGGWIRGNKELNEYYCMALAKLGFVVFDINYRSVFDTDLKGQIQDISTALNWIFEHAEEYHGLIGKICLTGDSAGGQLAIMVCAASVNEIYRKKFGIIPLKGEISSLGLVCPVPCLHKRIQTSEVMKRERTKLLYGPYGTDVERSEIWNYSDPDDYVRDCRLPPIYLLTLLEDKSCYWESEELHQILLCNQVEHVYRIWESEGKEQLGHVFNVLYPEYENSKKANQEMVDFFLSKYE